MNLATLKTLGGPKVQRAVLKLSKYAPEILTAVGITGTVASTVLIARATVRLEPVITEHEIAIVEAKALEEPEAKNTLVRVYIRTILQLIKMYGPGVSLQIASIISILTAHGIMKRRAVALLGAYKAIESAFNTYRQRVIEEFGEEKDRDYRMGLRTETVTDPETGKKKKHKTLDPNKASIYGRYFDEFNPNWRDNPEYNLMFLKTVQNYMNDMLQARGHVYLNEVYDALGFDRTHAGQVVGWALTPDGDNHIDFNIFGLDVGDMTRDFVNNGNQPVVWLDFNVDGVILDKVAYTAE
jgi:hypothetical protein